MTDNVFAYGTLMIPQVIAKVTGTDLAGLTARLDGFTRFEATTRRRGNFPTVVPHRQGTVVGTLYRDLTPTQMARLDWFEDVEHGYYIKQVVTVAAGNTSIEAWVYVCGPALLGSMLEWDGRSVTLDKPWHVTDFVADELVEYLRLVDNWLDSDAYRAIC